ncbi:MAG TPA: tetratricopeptide repeat protein [Candidatus Acidoferrum sp.]|jgi:tetratricopeptide (TPR) repeat protein
MKKRTQGPGLSLIVAVFAIVWAAYPTVSAAQKVYFPPQPMPTKSDAGGQISIQVMEITGGPFSGGAKVELRAGTRTTTQNSTAVLYNQTITTPESGLANFQGLLEGEYIVEVTAPGYRSVLEDASINVGHRNEAFGVMMVPDGPIAKNGHAGGPPAKALKEMEKGLAAMQVDKLKEAEQHLMKAQALAPKSPDVNYLVGVLYMRRGQSAQARDYLQKAVDAAPNHASALLALGEAEMKQRDYAKAAETLERGLQLQPTAWRAHYLAGVASYQMRDYNKALEEAKGALASGQDKTGGSLLLMGQAQAALHQREAALATFNQYLKEQPKAPQGASVRQAIDRLNAAPGKVELASTVSPANAGSDGSSSDVAPLRMSGADDAIETADLPDLPTLPLTTETNWAPPDVDEEKLVFDSDANTCPLDSVVAKTGGRVEELVKNVDRFTATEEMEHTVVSPLGLQMSHETRQFNYLVEIRKSGAQDLDVQEYRDGSVSVQQFPAHLGTVGLPTLVLVFHPYYQPKYDFKCEGAGSWSGRKTWVVHFQQKANSHSEMLVYHVNGRFFPVGMKGRAWIDKETSQILAMESDMIKPIPEIRLIRDHQLIEYGPVAFANAGTKMWLPKSADWYCSISGHRYHRRHSFSNFLLFSIDDSQKIGKPKETNDEVQKN